MCLKEEFFSLYNKMPRVVFLQNNFKKDYLNLENNQFLNNVDS